MDTAARPLLAITALLCCLAAAGCGADGGATDVAPADGVAGDARLPDGVAPDGGAPDTVGGMDMAAPPDVAADVPPDVLTDVPPDVLADVPPDVLADVPPDVAPDVPPDVDEGLEEAPLEPSAAFLARREEYAQACHDASGPGGGGIYGQVCRVALGDETTTFDVAAIDEARNRLEVRQDTADFLAAALVRLIYLDDVNPVLPDEVRSAIEDTLLGFRYWLDQPGDDQMCFWSENHQILFHSAELLVGQRWPETVFANSGWTGAEHAAHALPRVERWLDLRGRFGFSEWHSNVYFNEDVPALANLAQFAEDETIRTKAAMVLDLLAFDLLNNMYDGWLATTHGRTYPSKFLGGLSDSTGEAAWLMTGLGDRGSPTNFSGAFLATSPDWFPAPLLEEIAAETAGNHEHRQRDSWDIDEGPSIGVTYDDLDDVVIWAGLAALAAPQVVEGTMDLLDTYDLWDGFLFGALPAELKGLLQTLNGTPGLVTLATEAEVASRGIALEAVDTYTFRTPHYQLSGAQDYNPGLWGAQTHMWQATLDGDAFVFTAIPTDILVDIGDDVSIGGGWTGGFLPRVTLHRNVGVIQYRVEDLSNVVEDYLAPGHAHAYVSRGAFDELREEGHWVIGRKGDGYLALWSQAETYWGEEGDYQLATDTATNVWVVELGSAAEWESFDAFAAAVTAAEIAVDDAGLVRYASPSRGVVEVGWTGPLMVAGAPADIGPYPRWDNVYASTPHGAWRTRIQRDERILELDFAAGRRRLLVPRDR